MKHSWLRIAISCSVVLLPFTAVRPEMVVQACFSPQTKCSLHIIREIDKAQKEVLIAVYAFTSHDLARAVAQANKRGVLVQIVLDREFDATNERSQGRFLEGQRISLKRISGTRSMVRETETGLMHQKFSVIDRKIVLTGSYNWTQAADSFNDENLLLFRDAAPLAEEYRRVFLQLWERKP
jgi:phosphatidylserine/phosphatidylglycerophosphate/cardiolipin synthase-like enzyme